MADKAFNKSAWLAQFKKDKAILAKAAKSTPSSGFVDDAEIIELFGLNANTKATVKTRLSRVYYGNDKNGNPYVSIAYVVMGGDNNGLKMSRLHGLGPKSTAKTPAEKAESKEKNYDRLFQDLQRLGYETADWEGAGEAVMGKVIEAADELTKNKPIVTLSLGVWGDNADRLNMDIRSVKAATTVSPDEVDSEDDDEAESEGDETEEESAEEEAEEEAEEDDYPSWVGYKAKYKPAGSPKKIVVEIKKFNNKTTTFEVYSESQDKTFKGIKPDALEFDS